jgi:hypothetical protein
LSRLNSRSQRNLGIETHSPDFFTLDIIFRIEVRDLASDLARQAAGIEAGDFADARPARH